MRLGLIGAGRWGKRYISTIAKMQGVTLAQVASTNPESHMLVPQGCQVTPNWTDVAESKSLNGVIIATPPALHSQMAATAIKSGVPVLIEKPMTLSIAEAREIARSSIEYGVLAMVGHTHLFSNAFSELKRQGLNLGPLLGTKSEGGNWGPFRPDTPMLWDWGPHDISMCLALFESYPRSILAHRIGIKEQNEIDGETVEIQLYFGSDARASIRVSNINTEKIRRFEAQYLRGTLIYDDVAKEKLVFRDSTGAEKVISIGSSMPLDNVVMEFCSMISRGSISHSSLSTGLQVVEILTKCQELLDHTAS